MELRAYWAIIWRRIWLVALVVAVVGLYVGYQYYRLYKTPGALRGYRSDITIQIGLKTSPGGSDTSYADSVIATETMADAIVTSSLLSSKRFDTQVSQQVGKDVSQQSYGASPDLGDWQNADAIGSALTSVHTHNFVTVSVTWSTPSGAKAIANAVGEVSASSLCTYLSYVVAKDSTCSPTDTSTQPVVAAQVVNEATDAVSAPGTASNKLTLFFILALLVGIALTFLADYFDDRIRGKDDATLLLQLPVLGEVPRAPATGKRAM
ncbi:MAG: hypothetical protein NVSMB33_06950 [Ktedonobacteraceae bacterium]